MTGWHILISSSDLCLFPKRTNHSIPLNRSTDLLEFDFLEYRFQVDIPHRIDRFRPLLYIQLLQGCCIHTWFSLLWELSRTTIPPGIHLT